MIKKKILTVTISFFALLSSCVKINTLYDNYEQLEEKVLVLEGEISQLTSALNSTTQALETATANYNNLQSSSDAQISQLLSLIANLQDEKDSLEEELNIVKTSLEQLQTDVTGITGENNSLLETIASLTAQIEALEQTSGTSAETNSNTDSDIDFPDYKSQGHTLNAIGVWRLYSINSIPVTEENRFNIKIYPDEFNPNLLNNNDSNQTGWIDFNTTTKIGWYNSIGGLSKNQVFRIDSRKIEGYSFQNRFVIYVAATDSSAEYVAFDGKVNYDTEIDYEIFPLGLDNCIFYRVK